MTKPKAYKRYSAEFKKEAIRRASEDGVTDKAVCDELGISTRQLRRWRDELHVLGADAFPGKGRSRDEGFRVGRHKVAQLMRLEHLRGCPKRRYRITTKQDPRYALAKNLLEQNFTAHKSDHRWVADITYVSTEQGWLYLAVVIDLYSRRVVGWSMSQWIHRKLVLDARQPQGDLIHHSDRGGQYASDDFRAELAKHNIDYSMSNAGNCYDNAVAESFFSMLKRERVNRTRYHTREDARADIFDYIEVFYNRKRRHGYLGNISPVDFEKRSTGSLETVH